jgi:hypothetical protein
MYEHSGSQRYHLCDWGSRLREWCQWHLATEPACQMLLQVHEYWSVLKSGFIKHNSFSTSSRYTISLRSISILSFHFRLRLPCSLFPWLFISSRKRSSWLATYSNISNLFHFVKHRVKAKFFTMLKQAPRQEDVWVYRGISPRILNLGTR